VTQDRRPHDLGIALGGEDLDTAVGMVLHVGPALIVEVVQEPGQPPKLLVLLPEPRIVAHRRLDCQRVLAQAFLFRVLAEELPGFVAAGKSFRLCHGRVR